MSSLRFSCPAKCNQPAKRGKTGLSVSNNRLKKSCGLENPGRLNSPMLAETVGLEYVTDEVPGIRREKSSEGFCYISSGGKPIRDEGVLKRIRSLVIPPAWTEVWICASSHGHLQATGRDARGRKQYRYHARWRAVREETKYARMIAFGRGLSKVRKQVRKDMALPGLSRRKVLATLVRLLETSLIRVG